jgi:predicted  nucleic acid-binding Zn-ribbon protein
MQQSSKCLRLKDECYKQKNRLHALPIHLYRAKQERQQYEKDIAEIEKRLRIERLAETVGDAAGKLRSRPLGTAIDLYTTLRAGVKISELEARLSSARAKLRQAESAISGLEKEERRYEYGIPKLEREMQAEGCALP